VWNHRVVLRLSLCAIVSLVPARRLVAQGQVGVVVGATFSTLRGVDGLDSRTGLIGGLNLVLAGAGPLALQTGALFVSKGAEGETSGAGGLELSYVEIPVLLRLGISSGTGPSPHIYAGPYFGYQIDCTVEGTSGDCDDVPGVSTKTVDIGGIIGGGLDFSFGPLVLTGGLRYGFGVSKVADFEFGSVRESAKNGTFAIYTGLAIKLGG
jgi:hypothetical protein